MKEETKSVVEVSVAAVPDSLGSCAVCFSFSSKYFLGRCVLSAKVVFRSDLSQCILLWNVWKGP